MTKIRVLITDDHAIVRDGICALLALTGDIEAVGEATNGREALEMVKKLVPDVVLMDIAMPLMNGLEATRRIHKEFPQTKVIVLTQYEDREYVLPVIEAGAGGFVSKTAASSELTSAIRSVYRGDSFLSPSVARLLVEDYREMARAGKSQDTSEKLTDREREILKLLAEGHSTRDIARILVISPKTVERHKTNLMAKLDIHSRLDLFKYALRKGIITV
ncbi:MAG: response regulator transcription factor [Dehalococcoidia bacterium]|nr:response regulator transcription factor [Dehalococcoidia bacterium]MDH4299557.1 response regulator transcription factor [Dehalococcoidia bacterium]MDH4367538.1 response regulator transcription factor [Dehalococcoidia bacterium]